MNNHNVDLDQLFAQARSQMPEQSFDATKKQFLASIVLASGGVLATKAILQLFTKKWMIMMTIVSVATTTALVVASVSTNEPGLPKEPVNSAVVTQLNEDSTEQPVEIVPVVKEEVKHLAEVEEFEDTVVQEVVDVQQVYVFTPEDAVVYNPEVLRVYENLGDTLKDKKKHKKNCSVTCNNGHAHIKPYSHRFVITENTTDDDLQAIKVQAEDAGIVFNYAAKYKKDKLQRLNLNMVLSYKDGRQTSNISENITMDDFDEDAELIFGWSENEEGNAVYMGTGEDVMFEFEEGMLEFEEGMLEFEAEMAEFEEGMAEWSEGIALMFSGDSNAFAFSCDTGAFALALNYGDFADGFYLALPEFDFEFNMDELDKSLEQLEEIDGLNEQIIKDLNIQLEKLQIKLEELMESIEEKQEEIEEQEEEEENERERER